MIRLHYAVNETNNPAHWSHQELKASRERYLGLHGLRTEPPPDGLVKVAYSDFPPQGCRLGSPPARQWRLPHFAELFVTLSCTGSWHRGCSWRRRRSVRAKEVAGTAVKPAPGRARSTSARNRPRERSGVLGDPQRRARGRDRHTTAAVRPKNRFGSARVGIGPVGPISRGPLFCKSC